MKKYQPESKLSDVLQRLKLYSESLDKKLILPLIRSIYKNCSKFRLDGAMWDTEYNHVRLIIIRLLQNNAYIDDENIQAILLEVVNNSERYDFASWILLVSNEDRRSGLHRIYKNVKIEELRDVLAERLRKYFIEGEKDIFDEYRQDIEFGFILYQWATRWGDKSKNHRDEVNDYLIKIFDKKPKRSGFFLLHYVKNDLIKTFDEKYFDYNGFSTAYDVDKFANCLTKLGETAYSNESEKDAIDLFLRGHSEFTADQTQKSDG